MKRIVCALLGHSAHHFRGTLYLACVRCGEWGRIG